jgi:uncharacterized protein
LKFHLQQSAGKNAVTGYGEGYVAINGERYSQSLIVGPERLITDWPARSVEALGADHLAAIVEMAPEIVLLGTGSRFQFPEPAILAPLHRAGIGVEVMDTPAACRTYNILMGEGRNVIAAVIL